MENLHGHHHLHQAAAHNAYQYQYQYAPVASTTATLSTPQGPPPLSLTHPSHHHFQSGSSQLLLGQHHHPHVHHHHLTHPLTNTPSLAATMNPSPLSNSSSSSINAESVTTGGSLRRDTEVERIRFRLMLLEQQQQQQQHIQPTNQHLPTTPNTVSNTTNIDECIAALVRSQINSSIKSSEDKNNQLEALLNQREYEIKEMKSKFGAEKARMESDVSQLKSAVNSRDEELLSEKMRYSSLQKEHEKLKQKLNDTTRYLSELATKEETRELRDELKMAREEIEKQKDNINNYEDKLTKAKLTVKEKMHEIKEGKEALEREKLGKEKLRIEFENYKQMTKSVGEIVEKLEQNASLSAELECAKKLLTGLQEKMSNQQVKYEKQIGDLKESLRQQTDLYTSTKSELEKREETIRDFQVSLKELASENEELISKNSTLSDKMKAFEALLSADSMKVLRLLFKEMNECTSELDSLVRICMDINEGKEIDCCTLLGSATRRSNDYLDLSGSDETILQMIDSSHLMKKTNELREVRKKLKELKSSVADRVAEKIGSNVSCITQ